MLSKSGGWWEAAWGTGTEEVTSEVGEGAKSFADVWVRVPR